MAMTVHRCSGGSCGYDNAQNAVAALINDYSQIAVAAPVDTIHSAVAVLVDTSYTVH